MKVLICIISLMTATAWAKPQIDIDVALFPAGNFTAHSDSVQGNAVLKDGVVTAENIRVLLSSLKTGWDSRNGHLLDYFDAKKHPYAILIKAKGSNGTGSGTFEARGAQQVAEGTYVIEGSELVATFKLSVAKFKLEKKINYRGIGVEDEMIVKVRIPLLKGAVAKTPESKAKVDVKSAVPPKK